MAHLAGEPALRNPALRNKIIRFLVDGTESFRVLDARPCLKQGNSPWIASFGASSLRGFRDSAPGTALGRAPASIFFRRLPGQSRSGRCQRNARMSPVSAPPECPLSGS